MLKDTIHISGIRARAFAVALAWTLTACGAANGPLATGTTPAPTPTPTPTRPASWELVWSDEFNASQLDAATWIVVNGPANVNRELQSYTPDDVYLENGALVLRSQRRVSSGRAYTSGEVRTGRNRIVRVGSAVEWRTHPPSGKGIWPANWLVNFPCDGLNGCGSNWPPELDVMEIRGSRPHVNVMTHWWGSYPQQQHQTTEFAGADFSTAYHTFRVEWFPDSIVWYIDGMQRAKHTSNITVGELQLVMNTAVGGDFDGNPDQTTQFPLYHRVDYVRVYRDTANQ